MRAPRQIYTDTQEHLGGADEKWFKWNFFVLLGAIVLSFGTYLLQQALGFVGMGLNTVLFLILVWFLNTWLTSPTLVTGSWLAGLPFLRPLGFTASYLKDVVPFILFWSCGIVLVNSIVPWFWWPFLSYLYVIAITIAMGIWAWYFKPEGKIVKDLSWKFLIAAMVWALVGLPALSWIEPWFDPDVRAEVQAKQLAADRQAEVEQAEHNANVQRKKDQSHALLPAPDHQVVQGIDHLKGKNAGLYDFLIGEPNVLNARAITLKPYQYFDAALDPKRTTPRCTGVYPTRKGLGFAEVPGADRVSNMGDAVFTVVSYEYPIGSFDPFGNKCG
jgi:hypothetical protein